MTVVFSAVEIGRELADLGILAFVSSFLRAKASCMLFLAKRPTATRKMMAIMNNGDHCTVSRGEATAYDMEEDMCVKKWNTQMAP